MRISLALKNGPNDRLPGYSAQIADRIGQLYIHGGECLLHLLDLPPSFLHQPVPLPPDRSDRTDLLRRMEGISQQPIAVQFHQPLALLHVALASREVFSPPRVDQVYFETFALQ